MITNADRAAMLADLLEIRDDNAQSIIIRRKNVTLAAQSVRIARAGATGAQEPATGQSAQSEMSITILGATDLDIERGDRFNDSNDVLYEVVAVLPGKLVGTMARARLVQ